MESNAVSVPERLQSIAARIERHPFFTELPRDYLPTLASAAMPVAFSPGEIIFNTGDLANRFYLIESGRVRLAAESPDGTWVELMTLGPGEVLGWSWLFPPHYWRFRAEAMDSVTAVFLYGTRIREWADSDAAFGYALMKQTSKGLVRRLQDLRERVVRGEYRGRCWSAGSRPPSAGC